jgi:hypothetical protein
MPVQRASSGLPRVAHSHIVVEALAVNVAVLVPHYPIDKFKRSIFEHGAIVAALGAAQGRELSRNSGNRP